MNPSQRPDIRRLTDEQQRTILAEIRNARVKGCDEVRVRFLNGRAVKVIAVRETGAETVRSEDR